MSSRVLGVDTEEACAHITRTGTYTEDHKAQRMMGVVH